MKHAASNGGSLRCPLNEVFASPSQVRLLRVLAREKSGPLSSAELAPRAGLTDSSARRALRRLTRTGLVSEERQGRTTRFALQREAPLSQELSRLFEAEGSQARALASGLRNLLLPLPLRPQAAWIEETLPGWSRRREFCVFSSTPVEPSLLRRVEERAASLGEELGVSVEVRAVDRRHLAEVAWERVVMVWGTPLPGGWGEKVTSAGTLDPHAGNGGLDPDSPLFSSALAALLEENLSVLVRARENVRGRLRGQPNGQGPDLWEWQKILDTFSLPRLLHFLASDSPRAVRLRACSPFPEVLSEEERARLAELTHRPS